MQFQFQSSLSWLTGIIGPVSVCVEGIEQLRRCLHRDYDISANSNLHENIGTKKNPSDRADTLTRFFKGFFL